MNYKSLFPIFEEHKELAYLDSAATNQKPEKVIKAIDEYNRKFNASPNRGSYGISVEATCLYNQAKGNVARFINAMSTEIVFVKSSTEGLNLLANSFRQDLKKGENVLIGITSHHSNIVPWQQIKLEKEIEVRYIYLDEKGEFDYKDLESKLDENTRVVSFSHGVNATGILHNAKKVVELVRKKSTAKIILDACQSVAHEKVDVKALDVDYLVFSAHKIFGPVGIGVVYMKEELIDSTHPLLFGGDMIEFVEEQDTVFRKGTQKFEGGTQSVEAAVGLDAAIDFVNEIGLDNIKKIELDLLDYAIDKLKKLDFIKLYHYEGIEKTPAIAFNVEGVHPHDVSQFCDFHNVAIRTGHHCAQPLMKYMGIPSCCRASFSIYNKKEDIDKLVEALIEVNKTFNDN